MVQELSGDGIEIRKNLRRVSDHFLFVGALVPPAIGHVGFSVIQYQLLSMLLVNWCARQRSKNDELRIGIILAEGLHEEPNSRAKIIHGFIGKPDNERYCRLDFALVARANAGGRFRQIQPLIDHFLQACWPSFYSEENAAAARLRH